MENIMATNHLQPNRSSDFQFTIQTKSDPELITLKNEIAEYNRNRSAGQNRQRVKINGRGYYEYNRGIFGGIAYSPHDKSTHFDVYVYEVYGTGK